MKLRTLLGWAVVIFLAWFIIRQPVQAAHLVSNTGNFLSRAAAGIAQFTAHI